MARSSIEPINIAQGFGKALDHDDFVSVQGLIDPDCQYDIGETTLKGPQEIAESYRQNMVNGRKQFDELVWGECGVEQLSDDTFELFFTDHIKHNGHSFIHRSKQKIIIGPSLRIIRIEHVANPGESERLMDFFERVGIKV